MCQTTRDKRRGSLVSDKVHTYETSFKYEQNGKKALLQLEASISESKSKLMQMIQVEASRLHREYNYSNYELVYHAPIEKVFKLLFGNKMAKSICESMKKKYSTYS
jgi:hypothetical protein